MAGNAFRISGEQDVLKLATRSGRYPVTMLCWARIVTDRNTYSAILTVEYGVDHSTEYNELVTDSDGTTLVMCDHGSLWSTVGTMVVGTWHKVAMVITAGHVDCYFGTEGTPGVTRTVNASISNVTSVDYQGVGASNYASAEWFNGRLSGVRVWNAALTEAEIEAEFASETPVRATDLLGAWLPPTVTVGTVLTAIAGADLVDGNGGGTPDYTVEDGPNLDSSDTPTLGTGAAHVAPAAAGTGLSTYSGVGSARVAPVAVGEGAYGAPAYAGGGVGWVRPQATGSGAQSIAGAGVAVVAPSASGAGAESLPGVGAAHVAPSTSGTGTESLAGVGAAQAKAYASSAGIETLAATGSAVLAPSSSGAGGESFAGSGSSVASASATGGGTESLAGSGAAVAAPVAVGVGSLEMPSGVGAGSGAVAPVASGAGTLALSGAGAVYVASSALGSGAESVDGSGSAAVAVVAEGSGGVLEAGDGIGAASVSPAADGTGAMALDGQGESVVSAVATGAGHAGATAIIVAEFRVALTDPVFELELHDPEYTVPLRWFASA